MGSGSGIGLNDRDNSFTVCDMNEFVRDKINPGEKLTVIYLSYLMRKAYFEGNQIEQFFDIIKKTIPDEYKQKPAIEIRTYVLNFDEL